jgi:hypothetical protein
MTAPMPMQCHFLLGPPLPPPIPSTSTAGADDVPDGVQYDSNDSGAPNWIQNHSSYGEDGADTP